MKNGQISSSQETFKYLFLLHGLSRVFLARVHMKGYDVCTQCWKLTEWDWLTQKCSGVVCPLKLPSVDKIHCVGCCSAHVGECSQEILYSEDSEALAQVAQSCGCLIPGRVQLDGALSNLVWWKVSQPRAGGWNGMISKVPPNPFQSVILWFYRILSSAEFCTWQPGGTSLSWRAPGPASPAG